MPDLVKSAIQSKPLIFSSGVSAVSDVATIRIGPAGWSYDDWQGVVYARSMRAKPLEIISSLFDTVEINVTFYRPISSHVSNQWCKQVAANSKFRFTAKAWRKFTHETFQEFTKSDVDIFIEGLRPLIDNGRLGAILLQFPWQFKRTRENRFRLAQLVEFFDLFPLVVEFRHVSWKKEDVFEAFKKKNICFCNIDQPLFQDSMPPTEEVTSSLAYIRLHGRNAGDWFRDGAGRDERYNYLYSRDELRPWVDRITRMMERAQEMYVITNNHYAGKAIVNALELQHMLGKRPIFVPHELLTHYPRLQDIMG